ncbi:nuclease-related domain-containing protein [Lentibacillus jeotgali]|uniref:nuclease-related domain-containing protein n=1 Tax=Lentibacillus jeotgali TaxID=558169 RepID=UPI0002626FD1|nr:nuclease-related domain-containing protein [Lentibacillus jeotgali]
MTPTIIKYRKKSHALLSYEALFRRISKAYLPNDAIVAYKREKAGYDGERNVDYKLSTYPHEDFFIFQGIRLANPPFNFQIDTLILTTSFICILEVKNKKGTFKYDSKQQQLTQETNREVVYSFKDPILQAEAQKTHLTSWLGRHGIFNIPIEILVVVAYPSTIIENVTKDPDVYNKIIHNESLHQHLDRLNSKFTEEQFTTAGLRKLSRTLLHEDTPRIDILREHNLTERHLIKGIPCERCQHYPMKRLYKK